MSNKIKLSFVLPATLQQDLKQQIVKDGYDLKAKSRWVAEAIETLFRIEGYPELVKINDMMRGFEKLESISIDHELKRAMDTAVINVRKLFPEIDGVQSRILRTAIVQRLLS